MKNTSIEWTDYTWNPWRGCTRIERAIDYRFGIEWGPNAIRVESSERTWREPFRWAKKPLIHSCGKAFAAPTLHAPEYAQGMVGAGECCGQYFRARVFALSMGDWLEDEPLSYRYGKHGGPPGSPHPVGGIPTQWLARMLDTIRQTPQLHYILLTKRPENFDRRLLDAQLWLIDHCKTAAPFEKRHDYAQTASWLAYWRPGEIVPQNVCVMTSVGYQKVAEERIPHLLRIPARWHGLSLEPLLGPVDFLKASNSWPSDSTHPWMNAPLLTGIDWLVIGGESGSWARPCNVQWIRSLIQQGREAGRAVFVKQLGSRPFGRWAEGAYLELPNSGWKLRIKHPKGGDPSEWSEDLRVREWPCGL